MLGGFVVPTSVCERSMWRLDPERPRLRRSGGKRGPAFENDQPFDVVDDVGEADPGAGPVDSDCTDEEAHPALLLGEDVLDFRPHLRLRSVRTGCPDRIGLPGAFLRWTRETKPFSAMNRSLALER